MRIALFALTGLGNSVLTALCEHGIRPTLVISRQEDGPYPHFPVRHIAEDARSMGCPCLFGVEGEQALLREPVDLILVATYHRMIKSELTATARYAINLHPSLLPSYRGPNPFFWALLNRESQSGISAHALAPEADAGEIYWQQALDIADLETQGSLRKRLAALAAEAAIAVVQAAKAGKMIGRPQTEAAASYYPRPTHADWSFNPAQLTLARLDAGIRAASPFPGAVVLGRLVVRMTRQDAMMATPGTILAEDESTLTVAASDGVAVLLKAH
jgi:methionyl-tRNA formyltransferase